MASKAPGASLWRVSPPCLSRGQFCDPSSDLEVDPRLPLFYPGFDPELLFLFDWGSGRGSGFCFSHIWRTLSGETSNNRAILLRGQP